MTKKQLSKKIEKRFNLSEGCSNALVDAVFEEITQSLILGEKVVINKFAIFETRYTNSNGGRNPKTGEKLKPRRRFRGWIRARSQLNKRIDANAEHLNKLMEEE